MKKIDHKMAVFTALSQASAPVSSLELQTILGENTSPRSLRRWLLELTKSGAIYKIGEKKGAKYSIRHAQQALEAISLFQPTSEHILSQVKQPLHLREPVPYHHKWVAEYQPNIDFYLTEHQRKTLAEQGDRSEFGSLAGTYARHIYNRLLIDLSYNSSRLEGNTYSLLDTEKLLIQGVSDESKLTEEKTMILNHKEAIRYLVENASKIIISSETVCTIHYLLSDGLLSQEYCGVLRHHAVKIGGSTYLPIENQKTLELHLKLICQKADQIQDPFEQSFFLLVHLAYLQGFEDCNKRTSRLSANIPLIKKNLVPLSFNDIPKNDYINAMIAIYELNDIRPLADLYCFSYARTSQSYDATVQVIGFDRLRVLYREQRRETIRMIIKNLLKDDNLQNYIVAQSQTLIPERDREEFIKIMQEDIAQLNIPRIVGMGISIADFNAWKNTQ